MNDLMFRMTVSRLSETDKEWIRQAHLSKTPFTLIAKKYGFSRSYAQKIGEMLTGVVVKRRNEFSDEQLQTIVARYLSGESSNVLGKEYGVSGVTIQSFLRKAGIKARANEGHRKYGIDHSAFSELTDEARYWIGFLFADCSIHPKKSMLELGLSECDYRHVEKFRTFLGSTSPIRCIPEKSITNSNGKTYITKPSRSLTVSSKQVVTDLACNGVVYGKVNRFVPDQLDDSIHFWRGMVDGDGEVSNREGRPFIGLTSSLAAVSHFLCFLTRRVVPNSRVTIKERPGCFFVGFACDNARKILRVLYPTGAVALDRKYATARQILARG